MPREISCARCAAKLTSDGDAPPEVFCPKCLFINRIIPTGTKVSIPAELTLEVPLNATETQVAYPEFATDPACVEGLQYIGTKYRVDLITTIMRGSRNLPPGEQALRRLRQFKFQGRDGYYARRAAEFTAKKRLLDYVEQAGFRL